MKEEMVIAILYPERLIIFSNNITNTGIWVASTKKVYIIENVNENNSKIGKIILNALKCSGKHVQHPKDWKIEFQQFFKSINVKSNKEYMKNAKQIEIRCKEEGKLDFIPTKNGGTSGSERGFSAINEKIKRIDDIDPTHITSTLFEKWNDCE